MALRKKEQNYLAAIESLQIRIDGEATKNHDLEGQVNIKIKKILLFYISNSDQTFTTTTECRDANNINNQTRFQ